MSASDQWTSRVPERCRAEVHPAYDQRAGLPPHQCWFGAVRDGYCRRHHPEHRATIARRRIARLEVQIANEKRVAAGSSEEGQDNG